MGSDDETEDEIFYDTIDMIPQIPTPPHRTSPPPYMNGLTNNTNIAALVHNMQKELHQVKSVVEVNSSRLLGMEAAFGNPSDPSRFNPTRNPNDGMLPYLQRLDQLTKKHEEDSQRMKEREIEWKNRIEEVEKKLDGHKKLIPRGWVGVGVVVFLFVWPIVIHKLWNYTHKLLPIVVKAIEKLMGKS